MDYVRCKDCGQILEADDLEPVPAAGGGIRMTTKTTIENPSPGMGSGPSHLLSSAIICYLVREFHLPRKGECCSNPLAS